jgi:Ni,Fe-hydrogenase I cytochrome b subunit
MNEPQSSQRAQRGNTEQILLNFLRGFLKTLHACFERAFCLKFAINFRQYLLIFPQIYSKLSLKTSFQIKQVEF